MKYTYVLQAFRAVITMEAGLAVNDAGMILTVFWTMLQSYQLSLRSEAAAEVAVNCKLCVLSFSLY